MRVSILASGSSGNITLLETESTRLLVDAGLGKRETLARLAAVENDVKKIDGILVTHEHMDHCGGLPQMLGLSKAPLYVTEPTLDAMKRLLPESFGKRLCGIEIIHNDRAFTIGDIEVRPFQIPHDAVDPVGFTFRTNGTKFAIATDLGYMPDLVKQHIRDADCLLLESNHDLEKLKVGPYPWAVKQRIMWRHGHLSNQVVSDYLADCDTTGFDGHARYLVLGHVSEENNDPNLVHLSADMALKSRESPFSGELLVASQHEVLKPLEL